MRRVDRAAEKDGGRKRKQGASDQEGKGDDGGAASVWWAHTFCPWSLAASCCKALDEEVTGCMRKNVTSSAGVSLRDGTAAHEAKLLCDTPCRCMR